MRSFYTVTRELERHVSLDAAAHIKRTVVIERPAVMLGLMFAQIRRDASLQRLIDLVQEMHHQDVFSRDRAIRFQLKQPITFCTLLSHQRIARTGDCLLQGRNIVQYPQMRYRAFGPAGRQRVRC